MMFHVERDRMYGTVAPIGSTWNNEETLLKEVHTVDALQYLDPTVIALAALAVALIGFVVSLTIIIRQRRLLQRYRLLLNGREGQDIEQMLLTQGASLEELRADLSSLRADVTTMARAARLHVQKTSIVRFNAFPDTGSDLSFAVALLDANNNGFVLSSLYGRNESRIYAKPIQGGKSTYTLSEEEKNAIAKAMEVSL